MTTTFDQDPHCANCGNESDELAPTPIWLHGSHVTLKLCPTCFEKCRSVRQDQYDNAVGPRCKECGGVGPDAPKWAGERFNWCGCEDDDGSTVTLTAGDYYDSNIIGKPCPECRKRHQRSPCPETPPFEEPEGFSFAD